MNYIICTRNNNVKEITFYPIKAPTKFMLPIYTQLS